MRPVTGEPAEQSEPVNGEGLPALQRGFERGLALSRLLVLIPVIFLMLDAAASFVYGADILIRTLTEVIGEPVHVGARLGRFLVVMDTFLVGVTLMILAFGFYELFVITKEREGHKYWLPGWLKMHDIEDLKARVVSMLILVAAITFVDRLVESQVANEVLFLGAGIALVILGLTAFLWFTKSRPEGGKARQVPGPAAGPQGLRPAAGGGGPTGRDDVPAPAAPRVGTAPGRKSARQHRRVTAILGSTMREGRWQAAEETVVTAIAGLVRLDLRDAELPGSGDAPSRQIRIKATSGLGVVSIIVPPEMEVAESGTTVLGIRSVCTRQASAAAGRAAVLVLSGSSVLGVVRVRRRSG
jgi:uncharacterized membrane protein YqhA